MYEKVIVNRDVKGLPVSVVIFDMATHTPVVFSVSKLSMDEMADLFAEKFDAVGYNESKTGKK